VIENAADSRIDLIADSGRGPSNVKKGNHKVDSRAWGRFPTCRDGPSAHELQWKKVGQAVPPVLDALAKQSVPGECSALPACKRRTLRSDGSACPQLYCAGRTEPLTPIKPTH
jgi:hypothetical protein